MAAFDTALFGGSVLPAELQRQLDEKQATDFAQLSPSQQLGNLGFSAGRAVGRGLGGAFGVDVQDPVVKQASMLRQLSEGLDLKTSEGLNKYADRLMANKLPAQAAQIAQMARETGLKTADLESKTSKVSQIKSRVQALIAKGAASNETEAEAIASDDTAFREAMGLSKKSASDKLMASLQAEAEKRFPNDPQAQYTWIEEQKQAAAPLSASEREKLAGVAQANVTLDKSISDVTKYLSDIDPKNPKVIFGVGSNIAGFVSGQAGYPTENAQKQADIRSFITKAQNDILNLAKGTQTDKDALRAQLQIIGNMPLTSNEAVQGALNRLKEIAETTKQGNAAYEQSLTAGKKNAKVPAPTGGGGNARVQELMGRLSPEQRKALGL
jgi:hypothetical protein